MTYVLYERRDNPIFCPILNMLALAFTGRAFREGGIRKPEDIDSLVIPDYKERLVLDWRPEVMETPIFRTKREDGEISATEAWSYADFNYYLKRLGVLAGYPQILMSYALRRGAANAVDCKYTHCRTSPISVANSQQAKTLQMCSGIRSWGMQIPKYFATII